MTTPCLRCQRFYFVSPYGPYCRLCGAELDAQAARIYDEKQVREWWSVCSQAAHGVAGKVGRKWEVK